MQFSLDGMFEQSTECQNIFRSSISGVPTQKTASIRLLCSGSDVGSSVVRLRAIPGAMQRPVLLNGGLEDVSDVLVDMFSVGLRNGSVCSSLERKEIFYLTTHSTHFAGDKFITARVRWDLALLYINTRGQSKVVKVRDDNGFHGVPLISWTIKIAMNSDQIQTAIMRDAFLHHKRTTAKWNDFQDVAAGIVGI